MSGVYYEEGKSITKTKLIELMKERGYNVVMEGRLPTIYVDNYDYNRAEKFGNIVRGFGYYGSYGVRKIIASKTEAETE